MLAAGGSCCHESKRHVLSLATWSCAVPEAAAAAGFGTYGTRTSFYTARKPCCVRKLVTAALQKKERVAVLMQWTSNRMLMK
jgi:hypothetical protein